MGNIMKKWKGILAVILITGCLGGCSQFQAEHNAVKVKRDGSVQAAVIDTLDKSYYSEDELKQTIDDSVSAYNQSQEGDPIVVKKFNVTDGKAELYMNYAASRDYQDFNNATLRRTTATIMTIPRLGRTRTKRKVRERNEIYQQPL